MHICQKWNRYLGFLESNSKSKRLGVCAEPCKHLHASCGLCAAMVAASCYALGGCVREAQYGRTIPGSEDNSQELETRYAPSRASSSAQAQAPWAKIKKNQAQQSYRTRTAAPASDPQYRTHECNGGLCSNDTTVGYSPRFGNMPDTFYGHEHQAYTWH